MADHPERRVASGAAGDAYAVADVASRSASPAPSVWSPSWRALADLLAVGVVVGGPDGSAAFANRAWAAITGQHDLAWVGQGWLRALPERQRETERAALVAGLARGETRTRSWQIVVPDGRRRSLAVEIAPEICHGSTVGFVATASDVTAAEADVERLNHQATHDPLTGLLNRSQIDEFVRHALDRRRREPDSIAALLFIDVDRLKATNDSQGHHTGDQLLLALAQRIQQAVRSVDVVARCGGDEFIVLCEDLPHRQEACSVAQRIIDAASAPTTVTAPIGVSIGIAYSDDHGGTPEQLVNAADLAMYQAKERGGGGYHVAAPTGHDGTGRPARPASAAVVAPAPPPGHRRSPAIAQPRDAERLLATAAHELKAPAATVRGLVSTMRARYDRLAPADRAAAWDALARQSGRLDDLIDDLLDLAQSRTTALTAVALADAVADALAVAPPPERMRVVVTDAGEGGERLAVLAERAGLARVLVHLLTNAYRYGGTTVTLRADAVGAYATLTVSDDGIGVPEETRATLFEPFIRGANTNGYRGFGVGLPLARRIVASFHGELTYRAALPTGSDFTITLPLADPVRAEAPGS